MKKIYIVLIVLIFCFACTQGFSQCWDQQTGRWTGACGGNGEDNSDKNYWDKDVFEDYFNQCGCGDDYKDCMGEALTDYLSSTSEIRDIWLETEYDICDFDWEDCADAC